jgi:hypothetical protein
MSSGKANSATLLKDMHQHKKNVRRSGREPTPNPRYPDLAGVGGGQGRGRGQGRGGGGGGVDFDPPPSTSGDVAPKLFLEGPSRADESDSRHELDSRHEMEVTEEEQDE